MLAIPLAILLFAIARMWRRKALQRFGDMPLVRQLAADASASKPVIKFILVCAGILLLVLGIMNPQIGSRLEEVKREGADIIIALDVSNSMKAEDLSPNRLEKAKQAMEKLIDKLQGDRLGIIVFAGDAYIQLPITSDYSAARLFLESISPDIVPVQGTAISAAIETSVRSFGDEEGNSNNKAIIVITDGETHDETALLAAREAADRGIIIHTIGMGSPEGAPIPIFEGKRKEGYHKDRAGNTVITRLNEPMLRDLADAGNGIYVRASNADAGLNTVLNEINKLEYTAYDDRFQYLIAAALILLVAESLLSERKSQWLSRIDLFGERRDKE
jgi:Ca-activated chloride channel homolog